ncbi:BRO-N domain-containing protein [Acidisoma sp. 7E03]
MFQNRRIRPLTVPGTTWFLASDVFGDQEMKNPHRALAQLESGKRMGVTIAHTLGGSQTVLLRTLLVV